MKSKKLISLLCAAALTVSSFAGLATTASAADNDVFTFTDGSVTGWTMPDGTVAQTTDEGEDDAYLMLKGGGSGQRVANYTFGSLSGLEDGYVIEFDSFIHGSDGQGRESQSTQLAFYGSNKAADTRTAWGADSNTDAGVGAGFAIKYDTRRSYKGMGIIVNDPATEVPVSWTESANYVDSVQNKWTRTQAVIKDGKATITMIDAGNNKIMDAQEFACDATDLAGIQVSCGRGDGSTPGDKADPGYVLLDNVHIYPGEAQALTTDGLRGEVIMTPPPTVMPVPEVKAQAPALSAPEGITPVVANDFSADLASVAMGEEEITITDVDGISIHMGSRAGGDALTTVETADWATGDKVLTLAGGPFSGGGRGPEITTVDPLELTDGSSSVMAFAVNLGSTKPNDAGRLYIAKNNNKAGDTNDGAYNTLMAVLTTDENADSFTIGEDATKIGYQVEPYAWYKVAVIVSGDKYRVWIAKADEAFTEKPQIDNDHVGQGATAEGVTALPMLAVTSEKAGIYTGSVARIDNLITYTGMADQPRYLLPSAEVAATPVPPTPTPEPLPVVEMTLDAETKTVSMTSDIDGTAYLVQASYDTDGALVAVKDAKEVTLTAATAVTETLEALTVGDKIMLWNNLKSITPVAPAITVAEGQGDAQATPAPTPTPTVEPTATPDVDPVDPTATPDVDPVDPTATPDVDPVDPTATPGVDPVDPTATPEAPTPTPAPTYSVAGTAGEGVASVTLKSDANTYTGTIAEGAVTFTGVLAGTYTVEVTAAAGYKNATVDNATVTVEAADVTSAFAASATARSQQPYAEGTATFEEESASALFTGTARMTPAVEANEANGTKVVALVAGDGSSGAMYDVFPVDYKAKGEAVKVSFDFTNPGRNAFFSLRSTSATSNDRNENATNRIFTIAGQGSTVNEFKVNGTQVAGTNSKTNWYHVEAVVNVTAKTTDIKIYDYQATNDYEDLKPVYENAALPFLDAAVDGVVGFDLYIPNNSQAFYLDNLYVNDPTWVAPQAVTVTAPAETDGTLTSDKEQAVADDTVTITPTVVPGRKLVSVAVATEDGPVEVTEAGGKYTFTMPAKAVTVSATYARADIATIVVEGAGTASTGSTSQYTATAKAADGTALEAEITWTVEGATDGTTIAAGLLTVAEDEVENPATKKITVKASSEGVDGTVEVEIVDLPTYAITTATGLVGGSVTTDVNSAVEGGKVVVTPVADAGYEVSKVTYSNVPAAPAAVTVKYNAEQVENGRDKEDGATYKFIENADATASALFASSTDATAVDATFTAKAEDYIGTGDGNKGLPTLTLTAPAGTYKLYYLGYNNDATPITATIGGQEATFGAGTNIAYQEDSEERVLKFYTADLVLTEAVTDATLTLGTSAASAWLPDLYAIVVTGTSAATDPTVTEVTATEGVYSFDMPAYPVVVSAEFAKVDLAITNATTDTNGTITVPATAQLGDTVTVEVNPNEGYVLDTLTVVDADDEPVAVANNAFTMPAKTVTVTATFIVEPLADRLPTGDYNKDSLVTLASNATQTMRDGLKSYTVATGAEWATSAAMNTGKIKTIYIAFDFKVNDNEDFVIMKGKGTSGNTHFAGIGGQVVIVNETGSGQGVNNNDGVLSVAGGQVANGVADSTLPTGKWYKAVISGVRDASNNIGTCTLNIYAIDENDAVGATPVFTGSLPVRNSGKSASAFPVSVTGTPWIDNAYIYEDATYASTITVVDGDGAAVEGVEVSINDIAASKATTNAEGKVTFNVPAGEYTVTVEKVGFDAPEEAQTLTVTNEAVAKTITMIEKKQTLGSMSITGGAASHTVLTKAADTVVAKLGVAGLDTDGGEMALMPEITWTSSSADTTVENGVVTVKSTQAAGEVTITATANETVTATYTITVAETGTETVLLASDDFEGASSKFAFSDSAYLKTWGTGKVAAFGAGGSSKITTDLDTPVTPAAGDVVNVSWNTWNGWLSSGKDVVYTVKNSADEVVFSLTYNTNSCAITAVTVAGVAQDMTGIISIQSGNGFTKAAVFDAAKPNTMSVTVNPDKSVSATVSSVVKGTTKTFTVDAATSALTVADVDEITFTSAATNDDRSGAVENIVTTITRAAAAE